MTETEDIIKKGSSLFNLETGRTHGIVLIWSEHNRISMTNPSNIFRKQSSSGEVGLIADCSFLIVVDLMCCFSLGCVLHHQAGLCRPHQQCRSYRSVLFITWTFPFVKRSHLFAFLSLLYSNFPPQEGTVIVPANRVNGQRVFVEIQLHFRYVSRVLFSINQTLKIMIIIW